MNAAHLRSINAHVKGLETRVAALRKALTVTCDTKDQSDGFLALCDANAQLHKFNLMVNEHNTGRREALEAFCSRGGEL